MDYAINHRSHDRSAGFMSRMSRLAGMLALCMLLLATTGCNQMLAKWSLKSANKDLEEANKNKAAQFLPELLEQTTAKITEATNLVNTKSFKDARTSAKEAARLAQDLADQTKRQYAQSLKNEAYRWIAIADLNQGQQEDQELYKKIRASNEEGLKQEEKQKFEKAIVTFTGVIDNVQFLLKNLENNSKKGLEESNTMMQELTTEGAPEHAPEYIEKLNNKIEEIRNFIEKDNNYRAAIVGRDQARQIRQEGIQKTKEVKSRKMLTEIENLLDEATNLGAEIYALQNFRTVSKDFENLLTQFYDKNYDTVLSSAPQLKPRVDDLILETKREAAVAKMKEIQTAINILVDGKARGYLPGRVEQLEALLADSQKLFDEQKYVESKEISTRALELNQTILGEFDSLAQQNIQSASEQLGIAENVYATMEKIFDQPIQGNWTGDDKALEDSKQALKQELKARVTNARLSLGVAELKRSEKDFKLAIETSKQVAKDSEFVSQQTYRVVAHNAILEIANQLSRYEADGGRQYAAAEMDKTASMLEESKGLLHSGQYRDSVRRAADTKAQLEILVQELQRVAVARIEKAQNALSSAKGNRADEYQGAAVSQASVALDKARESLQGEALKPAIETAIEAENIAARASQDSLKQWAGDLLQQSEELINEARTAGADRYAPDKLQDAGNKRGNAQRLYGQGSWQESIDAGQLAVEAAHEALYAKVITAENEIATAKRFEGWEFEARRLSQAMISAKDAREMLDKKQYALSEQHANAAINTASHVTKDAKRKAFQSRIDSLTANIGEAEKKGTGYYQVRDVARILGQMNALKAQFSPDNYEDYAKQVDLLEAQLAGLVEMTPAVINDLVINMQDQLTVLENRGARTLLPEKVEEIERKIKYAQIDYKAEKYRPSYQNAKDAQALLDEVALHLNERDFDTQLSQQLDTFDEALKKFGPVLNMGSPALTRLVVGPSGRAQAFSLVQASSPSDLRTKVTEIGAQVRTMTPPPTRQEIHAATLKMLIQAKTSASNFEKMLIMDHYSPDEARDIIQTAFLQMYQARTLSQDIQRAIGHPQQQFEPAGVEQVVSYQGY